MKTILLFVILNVFLFAEVAKISSVIGDATIKRASKTILVKIGTVVEKKDIITTKSNSKVQLIFTDNTVVTLGKSSALDINDYLYDPNNPKESKTDLNFFKGAFKTITGKIGKINKKKFKLRTKSSTIGIRGTVILANQSTIVCLSGEISVSTGQESVIVPQNNVTTVQSDGKLSTPVSYTQETLQSLSNSLEPENESESSSNEDADSSGTSDDSQNSDSTADENEDSQESSSTDDSETSDSQTNSEESEETTSTNDTENTNEQISSDETNTEVSTNESGSTDSQTSSNESDSIASTEISFGSNSEESSISQEDSSIVATDEASSFTSQDTSSALDTSSSINSIETITEVAEEAIEDEVSKTEEPEVIALSLEGFALGSYIDTASTANSFSQSDSSFSAKRVDNKVSFEENLSRKYSNSSSSDTISISKTQTFSLGTPTSGGYTGHSQVGTLDFSYSSNGSVRNIGSYKVQADNMGELFVLYYDGSVSGTKEFNELIVFGNKGDVSKADKTKIYVYKDFASMKVEKGSSGNYTETKLDTTENGYAYYNPHLNSMTHLNNDYYSQGAEEFIVGTNGKIKVYSHKYNFTYNSASTPSLDMNSYKYGANTANITFMGTDLQGITYNLDTSTTTKSFTTNSNSSESTISSENSGASFLDKDLMSTAKTTGTSTLTGFIVADGYQDINNSKTLRKTSNIFTLNVDRSNGTITGDSTIGTTTGSTANGLTLKFNGEIASETSYYINDDIFGVMFDKGDSNYKLGTDEYDLTDNSGYLIAVPDGALVNSSFKFFDSNDNPLMSDDDSSWGYWTATFDASTNNAFISPYSTWVAGVKTPDSVINPILSGTSTKYSFEGGVIGTVLTTSGNLETIITDGTKTNIAKMTFDLGGGNSSMTSGVLGFSTTSTTWDLSMTGTSVSKDGFSGTLGGNANDTFQGKFYGQDSIKSVGGSFNATKQTASGVVGGTAQGVFKAIKK